jgi:hypothetical protein
MPRAHRVKPYQVEAASPSMIAAMFDIRSDDLAKAIEAGLPVKMFGARPRILVDDVKSYFRTLPNRKAVPCR